MYTNIYTCIHKLTHKINNEGSVIERDSDVVVRCCPYDFMLILTFVLLHMDVGSADLYSELVNYDFKMKSF